MIEHYVTIESTPSGFTASCICGSFYKKYASRSAAHSFSHLHVAGINVDLFELALAGKEGHV